MSSDRLSDAPSAEPESGSAAGQSGSGGSTETEAEAEAARLHEVGKLYVPAELLQSPRDRRAARRAASPREPPRGRARARVRRRGPTLLREQAAEAGAGPREALVTLTEAAGGKLDPVVVDATSRVIERAAASVTPER